MEGIFEITLAQKEPFLDALQNRILLFDGAMGTEIQKYDPKPEDFPNNQDGFNDGLVVTHPDWIKQIHRNYLDAGSDCVETNSFGSNKIKLDEYGFGDQTIEFNKKIAQLAAEVCARIFRQTTICNWFNGTIWFSCQVQMILIWDKNLLMKLREAFELQAEGLILGGVDALLIETSQDILEVKLVIEACHERQWKKLEKIFQ